VTAPSEARLEFHSSDGVNNVIYIRHRQRHRNHEILWREPRAQMSAHPNIPPLSVDTRSAGRRFGHLVVAWTDNRRGRKVACRCDCTRLIFVSPEDLQAGRIDSCGCLPAPAAFRIHYAALRAQQKREFNFHIAKQK